MNKDKMKEARSAINTRMFLMFMGLMLVMNGLMSTNRYGRSWLQLADQVSEAEKNGTINLDEPVTGDEPKAAGELADAAAEEKTTEGSTQSAAAETAAAADEKTTEDSTQAASTEASQQIDLNQVARQMKEMGISVDDLRMLGILYLVVSLIELVSGAICIIFSNRVDRASIVFAVVVVLIVGEAAIVIASALKGLLMLSTVIYSVIIPCILFWQAWKMRKYAKADPDRVYVIEPSGRKGSGGSGATKQNAKEDSPASGIRRTRSEPTPIPGGRSLHDRAMMQAPEEPTQAEEPEQGE